MPLQDELEQTAFGNTQWTCTNCLPQRLKSELLNAKSFQIWTLLSGHNMQDGFPHIWTRECVQSRFGEVCLLIRMHTIFTKNFIVIWRVFPKGPDKFLTSSGCLTLAGCCYYYDVLSGDGKSTFAL